MGTVRPGLDGAWLDRAAARDPVLHAYAVWDRTHERDRVRFVSYLDGEEVRAYLVVWEGTPGLPMVHWVGSEDGVDPLLDALPARPLLVVVPPRLAPAVRARRGPTREHDVEIRVLHGAGPEGTDPPRARRLVRRDLPALNELRETGSSPLLEGYRGVDPDRTPIFGAFERGRLVAVAKASVTLPAVWILTGIVVDPGARGRGFGRDVTVAALRAALAEGARPALYVRTDNRPAVQLYDRLGFVPFARRTWLDAGGNREP